MSTRHLTRIDVALMIIIYRYNHQFGDGTLSLSFYWIASFQMALFCLSSKYIIIMSACNIYLVHLTIRYTINETLKCRLNTKREYIRELGKFIDLTRRKCSVRKVMRIYDGGRISDEEDDAQSLMKCITCSLTMLCSINSFLWFLGLITTT